MLHLFLNFANSIFKFWNNTYTETCHIHSWEEGNLATTSDTPLITRVTQLLWLTRKSYPFSLIILCSASQRYKTVLPSRVYEQLCSLVRTSTQALSTSNWLCVLDQSESMSAVWQILTWVKGCFGSSTVDRNKLSIALSWFGWYLAVCHRTVSAWPFTLWSHGCGYYSYCTLQWGVGDKGIKSSLLRSLKVVHDTCSYTSTDSTQCGKSD